MTATATKNAKGYYKGGVKVSVGGVPCRMSQKPGEFYSKALKGGEYRLAVKPLKDTVLIREGEYAAECLERMGIEAAERPGKYGASGTLVQWAHAVVTQYLDALAAAGRPQVVTDVVDESEPMLDLEPVAAVEPVQAEEPTQAAPAHFEAAKVTIERKRFSTTQGEVLVSYDGQRIEQYGDTIALDGGEWRGLSDATWMAVAEREAVKRGLASPAIDPTPPGGDKPVMTYLDSKALYAAGRHDEAWEMAKRDTGLLPGVTREQWEAFVGEKLQRAA